MCNVSVVNSESISNAVNTTSLWTRYARLSTSLDPPPKLLQALPGYMICPWHTNLAEVRINDVPSKVRASREGTFPALIRGGIT